MIRRHNCWYYDFTCKSHNCGRYSSYYFNLGLYYENCYDYNRPYNLSNHNLSPIYKKYLAIEENLPFYTIRKVLKTKIPYGCKLIISYD
jgi:hypothetical protein